MSTFASGAQVHLYAGPQHVLGDDGKVVEGVGTGEFGQDATYVRPVEGQAGWHVIEVLVGARAYTAVVSDEMLTDPAVLEAAETARLAEAAAAAETAAALADSRRREQAVIDAVMQVPTTG